ncbi:Hypothetical_protein [Hexamita inflata]|uniref:Hypothetical_protein n=1 Tax=Hexamita inflata TaxID=28002 RepID=A0AA86TZ28_9EUKA|nr:Hypothetical protein HINF_LOCUS22980 [Hexamita inflata]
MILSKKRQFSGWSRGRTQIRRPFLLHETISIVRQVASVSYSDFSTTESGRKSDATQRIPTTMPNYSRIPNGNQLVTKCQCGDLEHNAQTHSDHARVQQILAYALSALDIGDTMAHDDKCGDDMVSNAPSWSSVSNYAFNMERAQQQARKYTWAILYIRILTNHAVVSTPERRQKR